MTSLYNTSVGARRSVWQRTVESALLHHADTPLCPGNNALSLITPSLGHKEKASIVILILLGDCSGGEPGGGWGAGRQVWVAGQRGARRRAQARPRRGQGDVGRGVAQSRGLQQDRDLRALLNTCDICRREWLTGGGARRRRTRTGEVPRSSGGSGGLLRSTGGWARARTPGSGTT